MVGIFNATINVAAAFLLFFGDKVETRLGVGGFAALRVEPWTLRWVFIKVVRSIFFSNLESSSDFLFILVVTSVPILEPQPKSINDTSSWSFFSMI